MEEKLITMFVADRQINDLMKKVDLRPEYKYFVRPIEAGVKTKTKLSKRYFIKLINESFKADGDFLIPAIEYKGNMYIHNSVKVLSDGQHELFVSSLKKLVD